MKSIARILEDFGAPRPTHAPGLSEEELETIRLEAFENGYKAGWDDAAKAARDEQGHIAADFARNLQDLSFTYHEAHGHVLSAVKPLLEDIVEKLLPDAARETLGLRVVDQLEALAREKSTVAVEISVAPDNLRLVEGLADQDFGFPVVMQGDDTLSEGQVFLRFGTEETEIDLGEVTEGIRGALAGFFAEQERKEDHG
ncbi:flagellar assembly protein FliH [Pseudooceanicola antarcticus]|uniref:ABC transporter ATP-binding protein n=1 Tax=Pseudooceanicola antarcticus TaxID=1247613 RepID=A0A285HWF9_9RHOB|nr:ABC transporter ATP-binding protein [Pseudooceanicola antarcticus]PJE27392.1 ABC transporter ATP-binding protein [Pseudooceanicola antarcticus]SNY40034.1 flagellar assembly protein FliH [Pseudooceanicola antarcticus]